MSVYHQIGYQSSNLAFEENLAGYKGAILSPLNHNERDTIDFINRIRNKKEEFEIVFDPQLYYPRSNRGQLHNWEYFPNDVDTADITNSQWWSVLVKAIYSTANRIHADIVCAPANHPRVFNDDYYAFVNQMTMELKSLAVDGSMRVLKTAFVSLPDLAVHERVMQIASILSRDTADGIYLVFYKEINPRREFSDPEELKGAMLLIHLLEMNNVPVTVGYSSSDIVLWKEAGAQSCATGKFFNLRKFSRSRWADAEEGGGGILPYIFEENLMANLRESDIPRIQQIDLLSSATIENPFYSDIQECMNEGSPWVRYAWRFYMYWFWDIEQRIDTSQTNILDLLRKADENWGIVDDNNVFMEERANSGNWVRQWLRAISEYRTPW